MHTVFYQRGNNAANVMQ